MSEPAHVQPQDVTPPGEDRSDSKAGETWDEVKSDYQVEPEGQPVPNSMDSTKFEPVEDGEDDEDPSDAGQ